MNPRGTVSKPDHDRIQAALRAKQEAEAHFRAVILDVTTRSSVREVAKAAGLSPDTVTRWKREQ